MKQTKRILALLLICILCFTSIAACSGGEKPADGATSSDTTAADTTAPIEDGKWPEVEGTVIYVDGAAEEGGDGTKDAPFKSITEAQSKIREIKSGEGLPEGGITVLLASGDYPLTETVNFTAEDSGTEDAPIKYMSAEKGGAVLNGGIRIPAADFDGLSEEEKALINEEYAKDRVLKIDLTKYGITSGQSLDVFIGDERLVLSRYPNATAEDPYLRTGYGDGESSFEIFAVMEFEEQATAIKTRGLNWDLSKLYTGGYLGAEYCFERAVVSSFDLETLKVTIGSRLYYGIGVLNSFYFYNIFAETDEFGEYYLDSDSMTLYVYPPEDFENGYVELSVSTADFINADSVSYLGFDGIKFTTTKGNGLVLRGDHITVENCELSNINLDAVYVDGTDITVKNNEIYQIGANAVAVYGGVVETLTPANNLIYNNHIYKWAQVQRTYKCAVRIEGCGITVSHNDVHDAPHEAIEYIGPNNIIEYNKIHNVCLETGDCGAIYAMRSFDHYGSIVRYNIIDGVGGPQGTSGMGIYWDDGLSGQTAYGNIIVNIYYSHGMNIGGGRDNVIENNLFINWSPGDRAIHYDNRAREYADEIGGGQEEQTVEMAERLAELQKQQEWLDAFPGYGDIIPYTYNYAGDRDDPMLSCNAANSIVRNNVAVLTHDRHCSDFYTGRLIFERNNGIHENNMEFRDPDHTLIPGYENGDYTIAEDSEVFENGFIRIPIEEIGRIAE